MYAKYSSLPSPSTHVRDKNLVHDFKNVTELREIMSDEERSDVISNSSCVVIDYFTTWCTPCVKIAPEIFELSRKYLDKVVFVKENAESKLGQIPVKIESVPCFHFYIHGTFIPAYTIIGGNLNKLDETLTMIVEKFKL